FFPGQLVRPDLLPLLPEFDGLRFQVLHTEDAADAYRRALLRDARGAFNLAAEPVIDGAVLGELLDAKPVRVPAGAVRGALSAAWRLRLAPASPDLFDAMRHMPLLATERARQELGWEPSRSSLEALEAFLRGVRTGAGDDTGPLAGHRIG
ncbi:NAD-dependent epimerase, partial [Streptomyces sp. NPDC057674]